MLKNRIRYLPLAEATTEPGNGTWDVYGDRWWAHQCQYCHEPLGWLASLLRVYVTCEVCVMRMSMGGHPRRPPKEES